tara:strand:+ start:244 stop:423 length:180 start_codon:yes stop_codon:yes gene_type:complete
MQDACGVRELETRIQISPLKQFQLKYLLQKKVEKLNFALVVMNMKLLNLKKLKQILKKI